MAPLKRQKFDNSLKSKSISFYATNDLYEDASNLAYENRYTLSAYVAALLSKAIEAEQGAPYVPLGQLPASDARGGETK